MTVMLASAVFACICVVRDNEGGRAGSRLCYRTFEALHTAGDTLPLTANWIQLIS